MSMEPTPKPNEAAFLESLRRTFKTASLIGLGEIVGLAVYLLLEEIIRSQKRPFFGFFSETLDGGARMALRYAFYAGAVAIVLLLRFVTGRHFRKIEGLNAETALPRLLRSSVVALTLAGLPAFLGLVLFLIAGYNRDFYVLLFVSLFLFFMHFPRLKNWEDVLQKNPSICRLI